ncbi:transglutaminase domain-containing protein [Flavitalea flava]
MKKTGILFLLLAGIGCRQNPYRLEEVTNPVYKPNTIFLSQENTSLPKFDSLRIKYQLDTVVKKETNELRRILLLREWIRRTIKIDNNRPDYSGQGHPGFILDTALKGEGFHCGHFMVVQNAVMNAFGYVTRCIGAGPGDPGFPDQHHGINEIWLNSYHKWFLSDAKYNHHFEKEGIPLSALEVRAAYLKNKASDIQMVKGPDRIAVDSEQEQGWSKESFARTFSWVEWEQHGDRFSIWPKTSSAILFYRDDYSGNRKWIWDGKPHWAYNTQYLIYVDSASAIEWTPNTIRSQVVIGGGRAKISLYSETPNFNEYQMKDLAKGAWETSKPLIDLPLEKERYELVFRAVNREGVTGPEHRIVISR